MQSVCPSPYCPNTLQWYQQTSAPVDRPCVTQSKCMKLLDMYLPATLISTILHTSRAPFHLGFNLLGCNQAHTKIGPDRVSVYFPSLLRCRLSTHTSLKCTATVGGGDGTLCWLQANPARSLLCDGCRQIRPDHYSVMVAGKSGQIITP